MNNRKLSIVGILLLGLLVFGVPISSMIVKKSNLLSFNVSGLLVGTIILFSIYLVTAKIAKFSSRQRRQYGRWLFSLNLPWLVAVTFLPKFWLGLTDGYLYSMQIHESRFGHIFGDWSSSGLAAYPPYLYSTWGALLRFVPQRIVPQGTSFALLFLVATGIGSSVIFLILQKRESLSKWAGLISTLPIFGLVVFHDHWIIEKPHEILALYLSLALILKFSLNSNSFDMKSGLIFGLLFGTYTSYALLTTPIILWLYLKQLKGTDYKKLHFGLGLRFLCGVVVTSFPWLLILALNKIHYHIIGIPPYFTGADVRGDYLQITDISLSWLIIGFFAIAISNNAISMNLNILGLTALFGVYLGVYLLHYNIVIDSSVNWRNFYTSIMFTSLSISIMRLSVEKSRLINMMYILILPIILAMSMLSNSAPFSLKSTISFSLARQNNVEPYVKYLSDMKFDKNSYYLAFGEPMFMNFSASNNLKPIVFFNSSYVAFLNESAIVSSLNQAALSSSNFNNWLSRNHVCVFIPGKQVSGEFTQQITLNTNKLQASTDSNQINVPIKIPQERLQDLNPAWKTSYINGEPISVNSKCG